MNEKQLEYILRNWFETHSKKALTRKKLIKLYGKHGKGKLKRVLSRLISQSFLIKARFGINTIYILNPYRRSLTNQNKKFIFTK